MRLTTDVKTSLAFATRLPLLHATPPDGAAIARASWALPLVGGLVGAFGAGVYAVAHELGLHGFIAATLALAATVLASGGLHEDGLADTADGFGGGATVERKLEIMRDSRIGTYGVAALILSFMLRAGALASLSDPTLVAAALIAAHAAARAALPVFMFLVPPARRDGLSAAAGKPPIASAAVAALLGMLALGFGLGLFGGGIALVLLMVGGGLLAWLTLRQIGGQTGDVLGALEQLCEVLILLTIASSWL